MTYNIDVPFTVRQEELFNLYKEDMQNMSEKIGFVYQLELIKILKKSDSLSKEKLNIMEIAITGQLNKL